MGSQPSSLSSNRQIQGFLVTKQISARRKNKPSLNKKLSNSAVLSIVEYDCYEFDKNKVFFRRPKSETFLTSSGNSEIDHRKIDSKRKTEPEKPIQINGQLEKDRNSLITSTKDSQMENITKEDFNHLDHWVNKNEPYVRNSDIHHSGKSIDDKRSSKLKDDSNEVLNENVTKLEDGKSKISEIKSDKGGQDFDEKDNEDIEDLSPEEVFQQAKENEIEKTKDTIEALKRLQNDRTEEGYYTDDLRDQILRLCNSYFSLKKFKLKRRVQYRLEINDLFLRPGSNIVEIYSQLLLGLLSKGYRGETGKPINALFRPMRNMLSFLMNYSDSLHMGFCKCLLNQKELLKALLQRLQDLAEPELQGKIKENDAILVRITLGVFHNLSQIDDFVPTLRELGIIKVVSPFLNSKSDVRKLVSLGILAGLVNEEESGIIKSNSDLIQFILKCLTKAMHDKIRRCQGWSVREITRVIRMASKSDNNKRVIYIVGAAPILVELANNSKSDDELKEAVGALWTLSFDKENQKEMVEDRETGVIDTLANIFRTTKNKDAKRICGKALWTMRETLKSSEHYKALGEEFSHISPTSARGSSDTHVMLSYNWGHQSVVKEICQNLRNNGIKVWMDVDDLQGSTLQAMAQAVEKADIVLVCYSKKYKNSDNCRAEAEYAFQLKKKILPLKMEGYKGDGWLGFIIGAKLFYDFSGKYPFERKITELIKDVQHALNTMKGVVKELPAPIIKSQPAVQVQSTTVASSNPAKGSNTDLEAVKKWSSQHIGKWLDKNNLPRNLLGRLSGIEIAFLHVLVKESPDMYYKTIADQLGVKDILTMAKLRFALEKLEVNI